MVNIRLKIPLPFIFLTINISDASGYSIQRQHPHKTPAETFAGLAEACRQRDIQEWDVYGDYSNSSSFLRRFESDVSTEFGMEDAVFMPSGVMAQSIALLIHQREGRNKFACHSSSHLILHEEDGYRELLNMESIIINSAPDVMSHAPMSFDDVQRSLSDPSIVSTLLLELPHRELGGKCTSWQEMENIGEFCRLHNIAFHCDGARIFEATSAYEKSPKELACLFDTMYISFYKGLGGLSGAMLLGSKSFCDQARVWLRRFGGNLYTLLPYIVSGYVGYTNNWALAHSSVNSNFHSFKEKKKMLCAIVAELSTIEEIGHVLAFDPPLPEVPMIHGYLKSTADESKELVQETLKETGIEILCRFRPVKENQPAYAIGYRTVFELSLGEGNINIPLEAHIKGWRKFAEIWDTRLGDSRI